MIAATWQSPNRQQGPTLVLNRANAKPLPIAVPVWVTDNIQRLRKGAAHHHILIIKLGQRGHSPPAIGCAMAGHALLTARMQAEAPELDA
jgi:hypothetical protein